MKTLPGLLMIGLFWAPFVAAVELRVVTNTWPPYVDENLPRKGLAIDIVESAFARAGKSISVHIESWPRVLEGVDIGVFDVVGAVWHTDQRAQVLEFSKPYLENRITFLKRKGEPIKFEKLADLRGVVVGVVRDFAYESSFLEAKDLIKIPQNHIIQNLLKLVQGEVDLTVGDERALRFQLDQYMKGHRKNLEILPRPLSTRGLCIGVSKTNPAHRTIIAAFNKAIAEMKRDGTYDQIVTRHHY